MKKCIYCDFVSGIYNHERESQYIEALKKEIKNIDSDEPLKTVYIGGGTPTTLSSEMLCDLIGYIFDHFSFKENYEATIEANPGTVDRAKLTSIAGSGINRVSIGIQSFNDKELTFLGRIHTVEEAESTVHHAKEAGFNNIGIDLIYGIPGQKPDRWKETLEKAVSLDPEHISTYELTVEKGTELDRILDNPPFVRGSRGGNVHLTKPDDEQIIDLYNSTIDFLRSRGYIQYEISNFSIPGCMSRHNLNYWDRGEYYGIGLGAHSYINNKRFYNTDDLDEYINLLNEDKSPVRGSEDIDPEKAISEAIFLGLRKTDGIAVESFAKRYGINLLTKYSREVKELRQAGLIELSLSDCQYETVIRLTREGLIISNEVFARFL